MSNAKCIGWLVRFSAPVLVTLFAAVIAVSNAAAQTPKVTIAVVDQDGKPVAGENVHIYEGATGKCDCTFGGFQNDCKIAPSTTVQTRKNGRATLGLKPNTTYTACVDDICRGLSPCQDATQCQFVGPKCATFMTNRNGGSARLISIVK